MGGGRFGLGGIFCGATGRWAGCADGKPYEGRYGTPADSQILAIVDKRIIIN